MASVAIAQEKDTFLQNVRIELQEDGTPFFAAGTLIGCSFFPIQEEDLLVRPPMDRKVETEKQSYDNSLGNRYLTGDNRTALFSELQEGERLYFSPGMEVEGVTYRAFVITRCVSVKDEEAQTEELVDRIIWSLVTSYDREASQHEAPHIDPVLAQAGREAWLAATMSLDDSGFPGARQEIERIAA